MRVIKTLRRVYCAIFGHSPESIKMTFSCYVKQHGEWLKPSKTEQGIQCSRCEEMMEQLNISIIVDHENDTYLHQLERSND